MASYDLESHLQALEHAGILDNGDIFSSAVHQLFPARAVSGYPEFARSQSGGFASLPGSFGGSPSTEVVTYAPSHQSVPQGHARRPGNILFGNNGFTSHK